MCHMLRATEWPPGRGGVKVVSSVFEPVKSVQRTASTGLSPVSVSRGDERADLLPYSPSLVHDRGQKAASNTPAMAPTRIPETYARVWHHERERERGPLSGTVKFHGAMLLLRFNFDDHSHPRVETALDAMLTRCQCPLDFSSWWH
jgi:hypothetical protein